MSERISHLSSQISPKSQKPYIEDSFTYLHFEDFLTKEEEALRQKVRAFLDCEVRPTINDHVDSATFPAEIAKKLSKLNLLKLFFPPPYGENTISKTAVGVILAELARVDMGLATFVWLQYAVVGKTIFAFGSEAQKQHWLTKLISMELIGSFGLTEIAHGSDANSIQSNVVLVPTPNNSQPKEKQLSAFPQQKQSDKSSPQQGHYYYYLLNGDKRWIGNGNRDLMVVWAKNAESGRVEAFIVDLHSPGVSTTVIQHKLALRIVQNCEVKFNNVAVPLENRLPGAKDFATGAAKALLFSRVYVMWLCAGMCLGVYDTVARYTQERRQFGVPIASFQLVQEKLARIMATTQAIMLAAWRLTSFLDNSEEAETSSNNSAANAFISPGLASMGKAWVTERTREVARLGRELLGGNGIISDYYVMKAVTDAEVAYTYEGTYDINALVAGRDLTGISAMKASAAKSKK